MRTGRALFVLGIVVIVVGEIYGIQSLIASANRSVFSAGITMTFVLGPLWQGGVLIGIGKILEKLSTPR